MTGLYCVWVPAPVKFNFEVGKLVESSHFGMFQICEIWRHPDGAICLGLRRFVAEVIYQEDTA